MNTIFAYEKSEYAIALNNFINLKLTHKERYENYKRMQELDDIITRAEDKIQIIITTQNTPPSALEDDSHLLDDDKTE